MQLDKRILQSGALIPMVAVLSNPKSTTNQLSMPKVRALVNESPNVVHYELNDIACIDDALQLFAKASPSLLVINGGDGTIGAVLAALLYRNPFRIIPPIAVMPGGKTNMTAADLGIKGDPERVLRQLLAIALEGRIPDMLTNRNLIELDLGDGEAPRVGTFFGAAGIVKAIKWTRDNAYSKGLPNGLAHILAFARLASAFLGIGKRDEDLLRSKDIGICMRGAQVDASNYVMVSATTLERLVLGLKPYGHEGSGGLKFSAVEFGAANTRRALWALFTKGWDKQKVDGVFTRRSNEIMLTCSDSVTLDGELYDLDDNQDIRLRGDRSLTFVSL